MVIILAGLPAERCINPQAKLSRGDKEKAEGFFRRERLRQEATTRGETIVATNWRAIERVADAPQEQRRPTSEEVAKLIAGE